MKARQCDECKWYNKWGDESNLNICVFGHYPRFYKPRSPMDQNWGWKRKCDDYEEQTK